MAKSRPIERLARQRRIAERRFCAHRRRSRVGLRLEALEIRWLLAGDCDEDLHAPLAPLADTAPVPSDSTAGDGGSGGGAAGLKWPQPNGPGTSVTITYSFSNLLDGGLRNLSAAQIVSAVHEAFALWSSYAPLHFVQQADSGPPPDDNPYPAESHPLIRIGHHFIDGALGSLAHSYGPGEDGLNGDLHFDSAEDWSLDPSLGTDFLEVAVHEIGHTLGLWHIDGVPAIMNAFYASRYSGLGTSFVLPPDIEAIQSLYGGGSGDVAPLNTAPQIAALSDAAIDEDATLGPLTIHVSDAESPAEQLVVVAVSSNEALVPTATLQVQGTGADRELLVHPLANRYGTAVITLTVRDPGGLETVESFQLDVQSVNDRPSISPLADIEFDEDMVYGPIAISASDVESPAADLRVSVGAVNAALFPVGSLLLSGTGGQRTLTLKPASDQYGSSIVWVTVTDPDGGATTESFRVDVSPVQDAPRFIGLTNLSTRENESLGPITFLVYSPDDPAATIGVAGTTNDPRLLPQNNVAISSNGSQQTLTLTPAPNQSGQTTLDLVARDAAGVETRQTIVISVTDVNDAPVLTGGPFYLPDLVEDATTFADPGSTVRTLLGQIPGAVSDLDAGATAGIAVTAVDAGGVGDWQFSLDGGATWQSLANATTTSARLLRDSDRVRFRPATNFSGQANLSFYAWDQTNGQAGGMVNLSAAAARGGSTAFSSAAGSLAVRVWGVNDPPSFQAGATVTVDEDSGPQHISGWARQLIAGPASESSQHIWFETTTNRPEMFADGPRVTSTGELQFTPSSNAVGVVQFRVRARDDGGVERSGIDASPWQIAAIVFTPVNDAPYFAPLPSSVAILEGAQQQSINLAGLIAGPPDEIAQTLAFRATSNNDTLLPDLRVRYVAGQPQAVLTFTPAAHAFGSADVTVTLTDSQGASYSRTVAVVVQNVNDAPVAQAAQVTLNEDGSQIVPLTAADADNDALVYRVMVLPARGRLFQVTANGARGAQITAAGTAVTDGAHRVMFVPVADEAGLPYSTLQFRAEDGQTSSSAAVVTFTVSPVADAPRLAHPLANQFITAGAADRVFNLLGAFTDPDQSFGDSLSFSIVENSRPDLVRATIYSGQLALSVSDQQAGSALLRIRAVDGAGLSAEDSFLVAVNPQGVAQAAAAWTVSWDASRGELAGQAPAEAGKASLGTLPAHGSLQFSADGSFRYQPWADYQGIDRFTYSTGGNVVAVELASSEFQFMRKLYQDVLQRDASDAEASYWQALLPTAGAERVVQSLVNSFERRAHVIGGLYEQFLLRPAEQGGLEFWADVWDRFGGDEYVQAGIVGSAEFYASAGGTDRGFVLALYERLLGRSGDQVTEPEIAYHGRRLEQGVTRPELVLGFVLSDEFRTVLAQQWYREYLDRSATQDEITQLVEAYRQGRTQDELHRAVLLSAEYANDDSLSARLGLS